MKRLLVLLGALSLLVACVPSNLRNGSLVLSFEDEVTVARTILPPVDMETAAYQVSGSGPRGRSFEVSVAISETLVEVPSLVPGDWTVAVYAKNAHGAAIGSGSAGVLIEAGRVTSATITVRPLAGEGTLTVTVQWPDGVLADPWIDALLTPAGGAARAVSFALGPGRVSAEYSSLLASGYYTLALRLYDGVDVLWGVVEGARVVAGQVSSKAYELEADVNRGGLALTVEPDMDNPIDITLSGVAEELVQHGADMTVAATTSEAVDSYQWYLQGQPIDGATTDTVVVSSALEPGIYWLSLVVTRGSVVSSAQATFEVVSSGAGVTIFPASGLQTSESGGAAGFTVVLTSEPIADVTIGLASSDESEGTVSPASLLFTAADWNVPQTVTVTGVDDGASDGNQPYKVLTAPAVSADPSYNGLDPVDVLLVNIEGETSGTITATDDPPGYGGVVPDGDLIAKASGITYSFSFGPDRPSFLAWGSSSVSLPELTFDGAVDSAGETLAYDAAGSDLPNGIVRFGGSAVIRYWTKSYSWAAQTVATRLTMTFTSSGVPVALLDVPMDPHGLPPAIGAALHVTGDFEVNVLLEAQVPSNAFGYDEPAGSFVPALDLFDGLHTDPLYDSRVMSSFDGEFYYSL